MFQGQYYDAEIQLAYNRFRYYDVEDGRYISQDPIGYISGELGFYNYVEDTNAWIDVFGLTKGGVYALVQVNEDGTETIRRTGRAKNLKKRKGDHARDPKLAHLEFREVYHTDDYAEQRGLEHKAYTENKATALPENGGYNNTPALTGKTDKKSIAKREKYIKAAEKHLKNIKK